MSAPVTPVVDDSPREDHVNILRGMRWVDWQALQERRGDRSAPRLAFLDGALEIMSPSRHHERIKSYLGRLLETWAFEVGIELVPLGSWTLDDESEQAGAEPDECYQVGPVEKDRPDLAIEVIWTSGRLKKLEIYRRLRVPEVWTWRRGALRVDVLQDGRITGRAGGPALDDPPQYEEAASSALFPGLDLALVVSLLAEPTVTRAQRRLLEQVRGSRG